MEFCIMSVVKASVSALLLEGLDSLLMHERNTKNLNANPEHFFLNLLTDVCSQNVGPSLKLCSTLTRTCVHCK